jgi:hypothetical protein
MRRISHYFASFGLLVVISAAAQEDIELGLIQEPTQVRRKGLCVMAWNSSHVSIPDSVAADHQASASAHRVGNGICAFTADCGPGTP